MSRIATGADATSAPGTRRDRAGDARTAGAPLHPTVGGAAADGTGRGVQMPAPAAASALACCLRAYLRAVEAHLARRGIAVSSVRVRGVGEPHQALAAVLELDPGPSSAGSGPGRYRVRVGWHEELGWWGELGGEPDRAAERRYLPHGVAPYPTLVADLLAALVRGVDVGARFPVVQRYRLLADPDELLARLRCQSRTSLRPDDH